MAVSQENRSIGVMLRAWRTARGKSQLALALEAGVSSRHLSFVETGRSAPSREMVLTIAEALDVPLRDRNGLLEAAGFAAIYRETPLEAPPMNEVRIALAHILRASGPNPSLVVNRRFDVIMANEAALKVFAFFAPEWQGMNVIRMLLSFDGLRNAVANWHEVTGHVVRRTKRELTESRTREPEDEALLAELIAAEASLTHSLPSAEHPAAVLLPVKLRKPPVELDMFTTITTLGTPLDITLQELRVETMFPADDASREGLARLTAS
jgi:transcriptional regulator with XRE-family HTH domain